MVNKLKKSSTISYIFYTFENFFKSKLRNKFKIK